MAIFGLNPQYWTILTPPLKLENEKLKQNVCRKELLKKLRKKFKFSIFFRNFLCVFRGNSHTKYDPLVGEVGSNGLSNDPKYFMATF